MSNLIVSPKWNSFINKVDAGEEISGGDLGNANIATRQLAENVMFLRDSMFTLVSDATGDLSQAIVESNKKTKDEFDIIAGLIEAQNEIIIAEAKARKEAISASNTKIAEEAAARLKELGVTSAALQKEIDDRKEAFRLEHISRAESEAKFTESLEEVLTEAEASVKKVENLSSQLIGGYDGSNLDFVTEGLLFQQKTVTSTAIKGMAEQISMLSAGVGEQFDTAEIWHFDKDKEDWINGVFDVGYLTVKSETVTSPSFLIDGDVYHHLKMRINKVGDPDWAGNLIWDTGSIALPEPVFVDDVTLVTLDTTWAGDITQLQLKLSTNADDTNYYKIDWITIGRPSPGASTASVLDLKIATATRDEALAQDIRGLSTKMDTDNALLSSNVNAKLETITTQQQTQATDITTLSSNVDTMNTKLSADIVLVNSTLVTKETALAESIAALTSKTNASEVSVLTQLQTLTDVDSALGTQLDALSASFDTAAAGIVAQNLVFTAEDLAQATQISQLTAKVDGNIAEVNTQIETLTDAQSANANKFTSISAEFKALDDKTDASDAEIRVNAADIIEERNARANDILAQATRIDVLTTEVGENAASATTRINLLSLEDKALAERLDVLTASTDDSKANINLRLTALAEADSAFSEQLTQVMAAVDDNDSAVHERVTALTTATDAEAEKLTLLTATVGANSAEIETTSRTAATNSGAIAEFNTRLTVDYLPKVENIASNILNAVKQTDVQYYLSISESQPIGGEWLTLAPTWEPSKYMFQRMETTYVDGTVKYTPGENGTNISGAKGDKGLDGKDGSDGVAGLQGADGKDGLKGPAGKDGESSYTHLAYATSKTGIGFSTGYFETATYIGMYVDNIKEDSENYAVYNWSLIKGADGEKGIPGTKGSDGKTSYLHIAYANSPDGAEGFSTTASIGKTYIGQYTDFLENDSTNYALYSWTLIKGEKGDQGPIGLTGLEGPKGDKGIQGPMGPMGPRGPEGLRGLTGLEGLQGDQGIRGEKGEDGLSSYTHIAYATSVTGNEFNTGHFAAATYIGMYVDNDKTDSTDPSTYKWSLIKGADGANGIPGPKGTDGKTSYLHIAYANNVTGNIGFSTTISEGKTHIGQYTDFELEDSEDYAKYNWTLIKGDKGDTGPAGMPGVPGIEGKAGKNGIQGPKGADGTSSYTHLAYATSVTGTNFNTAWYPTATYIGMYVDRTEEDSIVPSKYNWSLIKGADGANGIPGPKGTDGKTTYLHIAYANSEAGDVGFSTTVSAGKAYIGQYTDTTLGDSEDYSIYTWSLIKGADGLSSYAHLAYATSATGTNFNTNHFQGATYIGMYVDNEEDDSKDYTKYNWSLIKGADGANGIPGPTGEDGKTSYLHVAYATSATGAVGFSTTVSEGKTYIGQYTDFEKVDSPSYTKYKWSLIKGDKGDKGDQGIRGPIGLTGLEGPNGATGLKGDKGENGLNSYTHLAYATSATGLDFSTGHFEGATYIGMYVDNTEEDSDVYTKYNWSLIKGADGDKGIAGPKGADGKTAYLHIAYATSATGNTGFSTTVSAGKTYIGQYTDNELVDSPTYTRYKWSLIKGEKGDTGPQGPIGLTGVRGLEGAKGDQGIQGPKGANGLNSYTHLAYATSASGALFSKDWFAAATYIGMYVDNTETDSSSPSAYKWSLIKGADGANGIAGPTGKDGKTAYLHIAYATSANGSVGFSTTISDGKTYIGQYTDNELVDSPTYTKYKWSLIKGDKGDTGPTGNTGATGPVGQGIDSVTEQYAVSTSKTVVPTTWTTVMPEWSYGLYVWSRSMIKLKNPVATEYTTPIVDSSWEAVNNINVGGRNLLRDSNESVSNNTYGMKSYVLAESPNDGDDIVITIWGTLGTDRTSFTAYNSGGNVQLGALTLVSPGIYRYVGKWRKGTASDTYLQIYQFTNTKTSTSTINAIKLEKGNIGTEWSPAPEDTATAIQGSLDIGNSITNEFGLLKAETKVLTEIGGKISGWKNLNNGNTSSFDILADNFSIGNSGIMKKPFIIVGNDITFNGKVSFNSVTDTEVIDKAVNDINNLEIGGTNLISSNINNWEAGWYDPRTAVKTGTSHHFRLINDIIVEPNTTYIISGKERIVILEITSSDVFIKMSDMGVVPKTLTTTSTTNKFRIYVFSSNKYTNINEVYNAKFKIEKGNKATDWSPAPEDVQGEINQSLIAANTEAERLAGNALTSAKTYSDNLDKAVKGAFKDGIIEQAEAAAIKTHIAQLTSEKDEVSQKYTTIYANSNLLGTAKSNLASANTAYDTAHSSLVSYITSAISNGAVTAAQSAAIDTRFTTYQGAIKLLSQRFEEANASIIAQAETNSIAYADSIEVGGRNIIKNSALVQFKGSDNGNGNASVIIDDYVALTPVTNGNIYGNKSNNGGLIVASDMVAGEKYTYSVYVRSLDTTLGMYCYTGGNHIVYNIQLKPGNVWERISFTFTQATNRAKGTTFLAGFHQLITGKRVDYRNIKLERGSKATDWSPAPEDTQDEISKSLSDAKTYADDLDTVIKGAFKDGIIEQAEAAAIKTHIAQLTSEKDETTQKYTTIYANSNLLGAAKTNLASAMTAYNTAHTSLVSYITSAISNGLVTAAQSAVIDTRFTAYQAALKTLTLRFEEATSSIIDKAESNATAAAGTLATAAKDAAIDWSKVKDTRNANSDPNWYRTNYNRDTAREFKTLSVIGISAGGTYCYVETIVKYLNSSGGAVTQTAYTDDNRMFTRVGTTTTWTAWVESESSAGAQAKANAALDAAKIDAEARAKVARDAAAAAQKTANDATLIINDISADNKLTQVEKQSLLISWTEIQKYNDDSIARALSYGVSSTNYAAAYTALSNYITPILSSMTTTTTIVRSTFNGHFSLLFTRRSELDLAIANKADLNDKIIVIDGGTKKFLNPSSYSSPAASHTGYLIIETPIQSGRMVTIDITGYNYQANRSSIALSVSFYITGTAFHNFDYVDTGTYPIENVRLGLKGGKVVIIIGNATSTWSYPKIDVTQAIIGYTAPPDTYKDGWTTRIANTITDITNIRDMSNIYSTSLKGIQDNVYYPATTEIHGGNIRTKTIAAGSIVANSITAGQIAANTITATQMTTDSITARELKAGTVAATHIVGNTITGDKLVVDAITSREIKANAVTATQINVTSLSSINSNLGSITGGAININSKFIVDSSGNMTATSGKFSGDITGASGTFGGTVYANNISGKVANIGDAAVDTLQIAGNAITVPRVAQAPQQITHDQTESENGKKTLLLTAPSVDMAGGDIIFTVTIDVFTVSVVTSSKPEKYIRLYQGSELIHTWELTRITATTGTIYYLGVSPFIHKPPAGSHIYSLYIEGIANQRLLASAEGTTLLLQGAKR